MKVVMTKFQYQRGLSLIELMIALLLGALLLFGVFKIFDTNQQTSRLANSFSRVQESGRIAMEMIARDVRMADHWGCASNPTTINSHLDTSDGLYTELLDPISPLSDADLSPLGAIGSVGSVFGVNDEAAGQTIPLGGIPVKEETDSVTLKGSHRITTAQVLSPIPADTAAKTISITAGQQIDEWSLVLMADCNSAELFTNTSTSAGQISYAASAGTGDPKTGPDNLGTVSIDNSYGSHTQLFAPFFNTYFIGEPTPGVWSLYRWSNGGDPQELVRDVDDMQIMYGLDTSGNGSANDYLEADAIANGDWPGVVSVRITLATNSSSSSKEPMSRNYTVTANIRNRSL